MTRFEAKEMFEKTNGAELNSILIDKIYNDFDSKEEYLRQQIAYWKLSFKKQCEATNESNN